MKWKNNCKIQLLVTYGFFFLHTTEIGLEIGGRLFNSNPLGAIKLSTQLETGNTVNEIQFDFAKSGCFQALKPVLCFKVGSKLSVHPIDLKALPHSRFPLKGRILRAGGDALPIP